MDLKGLGLEDRLCVNCNVNSFAVSPESNRRECLHCMLTEEKDKWKTAMAQRRKKMAEKKLEKEMHEAQLGA